MHVAKFSLILTKCLSEGILSFTKFHYLPKCFSFSYLLNCLCLYVYISLSVILIIFIYMYLACRLCKILMIQVIKIPAYFLQSKKYIRVFQVFCVKYYGLQIQLKFKIFKKKFFMFAQIVDSL